MARYPIEQGDRIVEYAQKPLRSLLADGTAAEILKSVFETLQKQAEALRKADYEELSKEFSCPHCGKKFWELFPVPFDVVAKAMAYTAKVTDEVTRLLSFVQGGPDSRPDLGLGAIFEVLTDEQLDLIKCWVKENKASSLQ